MWTHAFPCLQVIAQPDERYESYCRGCDFIREHIFPGGHLPSMGAMVEAARGTQVGAEGGAAAGLAYYGRRHCGVEYVPTDHATDCIYCVVT